MKKPLLEKFFAMILKNIDEDPRRVPVCATHFRNCNAMDKEIIYPCQDISLRTHVEIGEVGLFLHLGNPADTKTLSFAILMDIFICSKFEEMFLIGNKEMLVPVAAHDIAQKAIAFFYYDVNDWETSRGDIDLFIAMEKERMEGRIVIC